MTEDGLDLTFGALADPTRRAILARLALGETSVNELAAPFEMSLPAVSRHLKVLEHAGLITRSRDAQWRPCKLKSEQLKSAAEWLEGYRRFWEESFDRLDEYLKVLQAERAKEGKGVEGQRRKLGLVAERGEEVGGMRWVAGPSTAHCVLAQDDDVLLIGCDVIVADVSKPKLKCGCRTERGERWLLRTGLV